jgi:hypothetical protein
MRKSPRTSPTWWKRASVGILRNPDQLGPGEPMAAQQLPATPLAAAPPIPQPAASTPAPAPQPDGRAGLQRRRDALAEQVTELHWDLGGLAYEMAIRDHFRLDVLVRRAAVLQERDAELAEVERLLRMEQDGVVGNCPRCAAPHSRGALYCWQCGTTLMKRLPSNATAEPGDATAVMDALIAHEGLAGEPAVGSDE